ncbi:MAG: hypothetical protein ABSF37_03440 [Sedimentisphaerales bacterium]
MSVILVSAAIGLAKPSIGKSTGAIVFDTDDTSKTFKVWNKGTGTLNYEVYVSAGTTYFTVTPTTGQVRGTVDAKTHTVSVAFNTIPHGTTVTGQITIVCTSANISPQYINLTAHDAIARHIQFVKIEQGIDYIPGASDENAVTGNCDGLGLAGDFDCDGFVDFIDFAIFAQQWGQTGNDLRADISPSYKDGSVDIKDFNVFSSHWLKDGRIGETYDFRFIIEADSTVSRVNFTTPDGLTYPDGNQNPSRHINATHNNQNGINHWQYQEWFYEANGLNRYPDGKYTINVTYTDNTSDKTVVNFGIPNQPGSIAQPTQRPQIKHPLDTEGVVSPLQFAWTKCSDSNVNSIRLDFSGPSDNNLPEQSYGEDTVKANALNLDPGEWFAELDFGRWYEVQNDNDITIEVGKVSRRHTWFDITTGFGTFGGLKNHLLQIADCNSKMVTFTLTGGGSATVEGDPNIQGDCSFANVILSGTTENSVLAITPQPGVKTNVVNIEADGPVKTINARNVNLTGNILINGGCAMIALNDISGSSNINIGSSSSTKAACSLKFGRVNNLTLTSGTPIKTLQATEWKSGSLNAPWISSLAIDGNAAGGIAGNFGADVNLSGAGSPKGVSLNNAKITGQLGNSNWTVVGNCGTIGAASSSQNFDANITGNIGTLKAVGNKKMSMDATLSGTWQVNSVSTIKATDISECNLTASQAATGKAVAIGTITAGRLIDSNFTAANGLLKTLKITGIVAEPFGIINSNVTAGHIGNAYLAFPKYSNNGTPFGVTAGAIDKVTVKDPAKTKTWKNLKVGSATISTQDFEILLQLQ